MQDYKVLSLNLNDYLSPSLKIRQKFVEDLFKSFTESGFAVLKNHPIDPALLQKAYKVQEQLFNLPLETKKQHELHNGGARGYTSFGTENAKDTPDLKDLKEFWHIGRENVLANTWPEELPEFKPVFEELISKLDHVGNLILEALGESLHYPPKYLSGIVENGNSVLRMLHYPPIPASIKDGQIRANAHSDIDFLSILSAAQGGGLEILTKDKKWIPIESDPNSLVINAGDLLSRVCNIKNLPSTIHRVVNPDPSQNVSRYSIPYFIHPRNDILLDLAPRYKHEKPVMPLITAGEYLEERLYEIGLKK